MSDVSLDVLTVWGIKLHDGSFSFSFAGALVVNILKSTSKFALAHHLHAFGDGFGKFFLVAKNLR